MKKDCCNLYELLIILEYEKLDDLDITINKYFLVINDIIEFKIPKQLLDKQGNLKSFKEQLNDEKINGIPYIVTKNAFAVTDRKRPLTINKRTVDKVLTKHGYSKEQLYDLFDRIQNYKMITKSQNRDDSIIVFTGFNDNEGRPEMISIMKNKKVGNYKVDSITSIYGRNNAKDFIQKLIIYNKVVKKNKKIKQWLESIGVQFSEDNPIALCISNIS